MAFGQQAGPPATGKQVQELLSLLVSAGHSDFRDARGPMGFTQRQAGGRFTRDEADAFIARLQEAEEAPAQEPDRAPVPPPARGGASPVAIGQVLRHMPTGQLADELRRRGCMVIEP